MVWRAAPSKVCLTTRRNEQIYKGIINKILPGSLAAEIGLEPGDKLIAVNGENVRDIIDLSFQLADENLELLIEKHDGQEEIISLEKDCDQPLGFEFESAVFDKINQCANKCLFCFIDQMPESGLRQSLYIKDDDYRLSFLNGNFITLTNLKPKDVSRIKRFHLSPLYVSIHTTSGELRAKMLNNPKAASIMNQLKDLIQAGISIHAQVVLCPGINDGRELENTIESLFMLRPGALSLAIVPVGLTRFRDKCPHLHSFTPEQAKCLITQVEKWQKKSRNSDKTSFVYLADEFYLLAGKDFPAAKYYDDFPQLENGVGICRKFIDIWNNNSGLNGNNFILEGNNKSGNSQPYLVDVICGTSFGKILGKLLSKESFPNKSVRLVAVENEFFGKTVTVTGLLTGKDILDALRALPKPGNEIILPGIVLREGENLFLDGMSLEDFTESAGVPVKVAHSAYELKQFLRMVVN